jgi:type VI secretion system protein ImpK
MTLIELTEPLFQYVCRLNRMGRSGTRADYTVVREELKAILEDTMQKSMSDARLAAQVKKMELPLVFFVDSMIAESKLPFAGQWHSNRLAFARNELAGDEKFFDLLEETMQDNSEEASERLAVYYTCIGLGFCGMYIGQQDYLRGKMMAIAPRIRHLIDADQTARICGEAYEKVDTRDLVEPPSRKMFLIAMVFIICTFSMFVSYIWMFKRASGDFKRALEKIEQNDQARAPGK